MMSGDVIVLGNTVYVLLAILFHVTNTPLLNCIVRATMPNYVFSPFLFAFIVAFILDSTLSSKHCGRAFWIKWNYSSRRTYRICVARIARPNATKTRNEFRTWKNLNLNFLILASCCLQAVDDDRADFAKYKR